MFKRPDGPWRIVPFAESVSTDLTVDFLDRWAVEQFLSEHKSSYGVMSHLREVLAPTDPVSRFSDDEVVSLITSRLTTRDIMPENPPLHSRRIQQFRWRRKWIFSQSQAARPQAFVSNNPPPSQSKEDARQIVCELLDAAIQCSHGRKPSKSLLEVVPAEAGDLISLTAKMKGGCGKHPEWSISGFWTSMEIGAKQSFRANVWRTVSGCWESEVVPHSYQISVAACSGSSDSWEVKAYPSDELSIQINANTLVEAKARLEWRSKACSAPS